MKQLITFLFLLCSVLGTFAQNKGFLLHDIKLPDSFSDRVISLAEKDNAGLLWLVANGGLYRYDGNEIIHFNRESDPAIPQKSVNALLTDQQNNMWIGTNNGLIRFDLDAWKATAIRIPNADTTAQPPVLNISCIEQGIDGTIYAGTRDGRLFRVAGDSLVKLLDIHKDYPNRYHDPIVDAICEPYPGEIWVIASTEKLIRIRINNGVYAPAEYLSLKFDDAVIDNICVHPSGKFLITISEHGIFTYDARTGATRQVHDRNGKDLGKGSDFYADMLSSDEAVFVTNDPAIGKDKLYIYNFLTDTLVEKMLRFPDYMKDNRIKWIRNTKNTLLFSLDSRIMEVTPSASIFRSYLTDATALSSIRSIYRQPGGPLYAGSYKHGFVRIDETTLETETLSPMFVYSILPWNADTLLLATEGDGLFWYEQEANRFSPLIVRSEGKEKRLLGNFLTTLRRVNDHQVLVGAYEGLTLVDPYTKTFLDIGRDHLKTSKILSVAGVNNKWIIGTSHGIVQWNGKTNAVRNFLKDIPGGGEHYPVYGIARVNGQIWMGTHGDGILVADREGNIMDTIDNARGLANNIVYSLLVSGGYVIAGTNTGLSVINTETGSIRNYFRKDRLPSDEFNGAAVFMAGDTVYLGTINGIIQLNTNSLDLREQPEFRAPIRITSLTSEHDNTGIRHNYSLAYAPDSALIIDPGVRYFSIAFGGLDKSAEQLQYYYRLNDHEEWLPIGQRQEITFVEMPPGDYELQLAALLPDGQWSHSLLHLPLIVKPAFQQTIWFKLLFALGFVAVIWSIFKYRENVQLKEKKLRIKIASDLHDEVGSSLTRIYFQADTLSANPDPLPGDRQQLKTIAATSQDALFTMGDLVWSIDSRFDTLKDLVIRMKDYLYTLRQELNIDSQFNIYGNHDATPLSQIIRQNLFLIFKEALTNAIKHGDGSEILINLDLEHPICLEIKNSYATDNNPIESYQGGQGVKSMRRRAANMNGELAITHKNGIFHLRLATNTSSYPKGEYKLKPATNTFAK